MKPSTRAAALLALLAGLSACGGEEGPSPAAGGDGRADREAADGTIWADLPRDTWSPIIDTRAPPDTGPPDAAAAVDAGSDAAGLPKPATVPADLPPDVTAIALSSVLLEQDGGSPTLPVTLPPGTTSFVAVILGQYPGHFAVATAVNPLGDLLGKGICTTLCTTCKNRLGATPATGAALFPSSSGVKVTGGTWHLSTCGLVWTQTGNSFSTVGAKGMKTETLLFVRTGPGGKAPAKGRLKLRLWLSTTRASAATSYDLPLVQGMLSGAALALASAAIELVVLDRLDAPAGYAHISVPAELTTDPSGPADQLFAAAEAVGGSAVLDVFVVDELGGQQEGGRKLGGWSGGIPGPAFYPGRPRAGVIVALDALPEAAAAGRRLAHEIGHYLGLWNTSEANGTGHDPLDDTPPCGPARDANGDGVLSAQECAPLDGGNAMFWETPAAKAGFSPEQGAIMRGNPLVWPG